MYASWFPIKNSDDFKIYICKGKSIGGKKSKIVIEKYESAKALGSSKDEISNFISERISYLENLEKERKEQNSDLKIDFMELIENECNEKKNGGMLFLQKAWYDLGLESFFNKWVFDSKTKIKYSLNDSMRLLCYSRVIHPGSKLYTSSLINNYIEPFKINIDNLYDTLDKIDLFSDKLTKFLSKKIGQIKSNNSESIYYDCTNFFFEIQNEDEEGLRKYGVEKNHRPDPIVEYGLLLDDNGWPIDSITFKGNESEKLSLKDLLVNLDSKAKNSKYICADAGLNTTNNKDIIISSGRSYIFSQGIKGLSNKSKDGVESLRDWACNGKNMVSYGSPNKKGEYKKYKERWIKRTNNLEEKLIVKFDPDSKKFMLKTIEKRVERAKKFIENPSKLNYKNCQDGKEYIQRVVVDKNTGEILVDKCDLILNDELIKKEKEEAGYYCFVTDLPSKKDLEEDEELRKERELIGLKNNVKEPIEVLEIAGKRVIIEDCFRVMKTNMEARPIYVRTKEHIKSHLYTVYLALVLMTYLKNVYSLESTNEELFNSIRNFDFVKINDDLYRIIFMNKSVKELIEKIGLKELNYKNHTYKNIRNIISRSKNR